jgi:hypothetical protein
VSTKQFDKIIKKITKKVGEKNVASDPVFLAFLSGLSAGSDAVARRWIEHHATSALVYAFGREAVLKAKPTA